MPKSKRAKLVSLTKTKQARKELKGRLVEDVRAAAEKFDAAFVFGYENLRTERFKDLRVEWAGNSRFFLGKNKVMQIALGTDEDSAHRPGLHQLAGDLSGNVGLLFTSRPTEEVTAFFEAFGEPDYARAGFVPSETIKVPAGKLASMPHTMFDELRKLGMPVRLDKGTLVLPQDYTLCHAGKAITPEQGRLLKHFGHQLAVFRVTPLSVVRDGVYTPLLSAGALLARSSKYAGEGDDEEEEDAGADSDDAGAAGGSDEEEEEAGAGSAAAAAAPAAKGKGGKAAKGAAAAAPAAKPGKAAAAAAAAGGAGSAASGKSSGKKGGKGKKASGGMEEDA